MPLLLYTLIILVEFLNTISFAVFDVADDSEDSDLVDVDGEELNIGAEVIKSWGRSAGRTRGRALMGRRSKSPRVRVKSPPEGANKSPRSDTHASLPEFAGVPVEAKIERADSLMGIPDNDFGAPPLERLDSL